MTSPVIQTRDLTKYYGRALGVEAIDLTVEPGEVFGFLGPNGSGKTTTIRLLLDLIRPTRGEARLFGRAPSDHAARVSVGYLPGELTLDQRLTGQEMLEFMDRLRPRSSQPTDPKRRAEICERLYLTAADLKRTIRDDSRGTKQRIGLAAALQHQPDLLILDEPTTGLDPLVRESVFELLTEAGRAGRTVFHSSHVLTEVDRTCTRVGILRQGRLVAVQRIDDMRRSLVRKMVIRFDGRVPTDQLKTLGVEIVSQHHSEVELHLPGDLDPLLHLLAQHSIKDLAFPEPNLEDAFVRYYRNDPKDGTE